jgi:peptidyl-prolyl cis-trans isomerase D
MFDLFRSRDKAVRILLGALLLLVALSMLTYLIPTYDTGGGTGNGQVVAEVGKDVITVPDVQRVIQNNLRDRQLPTELLPNFIPQMVQDLITDRALQYEADRLGFQVTDSDVREAIRQTVPALFPGGNFVGKDAYAAMLAQQNLSIAEFENDLRRQILVTRLRNIALEGMVVSPAEVQAAFIKKNEKMKIEWVKLSADKYKNELEPSLQDLQTYYNANKLAYQKPERKNLILLVADQAKMEQSINISDAELQRSYDQNKDQYRTPETVDVRHILLKTTDKPAAEEAKIKEKAQDIEKQLKAGANFAELAKKYSEDPGAAQTGGEYKGVTRGQMVPEFEQAAFSLKPGEISDPVKTTYGYHILQVEKHDQARLKPFAEAKGDIAATLKKQRASDLMQQIADKAQTELKNDPAHPEKVAAEFNMQLIKADGVQPGKPVPEVGTSGDFDQSLVGLKKGEVSQPVALANSKLVLAVVADIVPPEPSTFEEVKNQIKDTMTRARTQQALQKHAQELLQKAKAENGDVGKAAKSMGLDAKTSNPVGLADTIEGMGATSILADAFSKPEGTLFGPLTATDGSTVVGKVVQRIQPDPSQLAAQRTNLIDEIRSQRARDRNALFEAGIRETLVKEKKIKIYQDVITRLINDYVNNNKG